MMVAYRGLSTTYGPTDLHRESLKLGLEELKPLQSELKKLAGEMIPELWKSMKEAGAPLVDDLVYEPRYF